MNFVPIKDYEGLYEINNEGVIRSLDRKVIGRNGAIYPRKGTVMRYKLTLPTKYYHTHLSKNNNITTVYVHKLVAEHFVPNPENKLRVRHIDGNKLNNNSNNLEWFNPIKRTYHGIYTKTQLNQYLNDVIGGESFSEIAKRLSCSISSISTKIRNLAIKKGMENKLNEAMLLQKSIRSKNRFSNKKKEIK